MPSALKYQTLRLQLNVPVICILIQISSHHEVPLWPEEQPYLHPTLSCMHCRFYQDHLLNTCEKICNSTTILTRSLPMDKKSLQYMNQPIQLLGNVIERGATKFSVKGMDFYSIVHISFYLGKCMTKCLDGICASLYKTHKKVPEEDINKQQEQVLLTSQHDV